jgi:hypothetical protein
MIIIVSVGFSAGLGLVLRAKVFAQCNSFDTDDNGFEIL